MRHVVLVAGGVWGGLPRSATLSCARHPWNDILVAGDFCICSRRNLHEVVHKPGSEGFVVFCDIPSRSGTSLMLTSVDGCHMLDKCQLIVSPPMDTSTSCTLMWVPRPARVPNYCSTLRCPSTWDTLHTSTSSSRGRENAAVAFGSVRAVL